MESQAEARCRIGVFVLVTILCGHAVCARAQSDPHPLATPDLSSPRATLTNFLTRTSSACSHWKAEGRTDQKHLQRAAIARLAHQFLITLQILEGMATQGIQLAKQPPLNALNLPGN